jgi:hypothetical protein
MQQELTTDYETLAKLLRSERQALRERNLEKLRALEPQIRNYILKISGYGDLIAELPRSDRIKLKSQAQLLSKEVESSRQTWVEHLSELSELRAQLLAAKRYVTARGSEAAGRSKRISHSA